ncbi:thioredoxin domain-containing protein 5 homolog [Teleopsis dalmanni]|uniref:thioredoxin domain-containing protein 5 homolog n=1 Tax=Teleopsis dalmanni TaxID=139649 RepID=UPI0018CE7B6F|nr:thioredoxin domain-containing protein 5 homolog [Teleopsis dalmanni]
MNLGRLVCVSVFGILLAHLAKGSEPATENFAVPLNSKNFDEEMQKNNHFVMFFAPWCGHCKRLHPLWEQLAEIMNVKDAPTVIISKVDCTEHQDLCNEHEVTGYPTLRFFKRGETGSIKFKGTRDMPAITDFINQQLNREDENVITKEVEEVKPALSSTGKLIELNEENFAKHVSTGNHFVKFYAPWCSHCQRLAPTWEELAKVFENKDSVSIAKIDCTVNRPICQDFEVKGYPTLLWIEDGKKIEKYSGTRDLETLKTYTLKMLDAYVNTNDAEIEVVNVDNSKPVLLTADDFEKHTNEGVLFVMFYAPWCGHCQKLGPIWEQLAVKMHASNKNVKIAKIDCTQSENKAVCQEQEVAGYPTLILYKNGDKQPEYDGARGLADLQHYINKMIGHDEL